MSAMLSRSLAFNPFCKKVANIVMIFYFLILQIYFLRTANMTDRWLEGLSPGILNRSGS